MSTQIDMVPVKPTTAIVGEADTATGKAMKAAVFAGNAKVAKMSEDEIVTSARENKKHKDPVKTLPDDVLKAAAGYVKSLASK